MQKKKQSVRSDEGDTAKDLSFDPAELTSGPSTATEQDSLIDALKSESGIKKKIAKERGYRRVHEPAELQKMGFSPKKASRIVPGIEIPLYGPDGDRLGQDFRPDHPEVDKRTGKPRKYDKPQGTRNVVDVHPSLRETIADPAVDLWITEGIKKADSAVSQGLCCIGLSGVDNFVYKPNGSRNPAEPCPEWDAIALAGRRVFVAYDSDSASNPRVQAARHRLTEFLMSRNVGEVLWVDPPAEGDAKVGLDDYFVGGGTVEALKASAHPPVEEEKGQKQNLAGTVIGWVEQHYELFSTPQGSAFAVPCEGAKIPVEFPETGGSLTNKVRNEIYTETGKTINKSTVSDAMGIIHQRALNGTRVELHLRVARVDDDTRVIDLAEPDTTRCIVVTPDGWVVHPEPPPGIYFKRQRGQALPDPTRGAKNSAEPGTGRKALAKILGWKPKSREFLLAWSWAVVAPLAEIQRPMIFLVGAPGSAKTFRGLALIGVWDPRPALGSAFGKNLDDDQVKANGQFLLGYDNVSRISEAQSDHICRVVTGDSPEKRALYTDDALHQMYYRRTGVMTSVSMPTGVKADAMERLIPLDASRLKKYKSESKLVQELNAVRPAILADVLDGLVRVLAGLRDRRGDDDAMTAQRMAEYWLALDCLGRAYSEAFEEHNREGMVEMAENDPWIKSVAGWVSSLPNGEFVGSPREGFESYGDYLANTSVLSSSRIEESRLPKNPGALSRAMQNNTTPLRAVGVWFENGRSNGERRWTIRVQR